MQTPSELQPERMVYGRRPLIEALSGQRRVRRLWASEWALKDLRSTTSIPDRIQTGTLDPFELDDLAQSEDHQGVVAEVDGFPYCALEELLAGESPLVFCLDQVTDPHNLGAIARVCDATGGSGIIIGERRSAAVTAAVSKASAGAIEHVRVARCTNTAEALERCKSDTVWIYGASEKGAVGYTDVDFATGGVVLVLGSEGAGIRPRVLRTCDETITLPMRGHVGSLNVATVSAVLAYEILRQRGAR